MKICANPLRTIPFLILAIIAFPALSNFPNEVEDHYAMAETDTIMKYRGLDAVVVTASRSARGIYEVPVRLDLVDRSSIEAMPSFSADEFLRSVPGISVSRGASIFGASTVSMRGMGSEAGRTLVMMDGVPINKTDGGSVNWNAINVDEIEQIEVMKGPGSGIYGGNAMGGVINIITPTPQQGIQGSIGQSFGTFLTSNTLANVTGRQENFFWGVNGRYRTSDGYISEFADDIDEFTVESFLNEYQAGGRAGYFFSPDQMIDATASFYSGQRGTGSNFNGFGFQNEEFAAPDGAYNQYDVLSGRVIYRGDFKEAGQLNITLFGQRELYQNIRESVRNNVISRFDVESVRSDIGFLSSYNLELGSMHRITAGIDLRNGAVDGADIYLTSTDRVLNLGKMNQLGIFIQDEISLPGTPISFLANIRYDYAGFYDGAFIVEDPTNETAFLQDFDGVLDDASFSAISPRFSVQYFMPGQFRIYTGYSRGFRAPVLDDMCRTGRISGGMKLANPNLQPEYLDNFELGGDIFLANRITISPAVFYSIGTDYHAYIATGDSLIMNNRMRPIRIKDNIGEVELLGAELSLSAQIANGLEFSAAYAYTETNIKSFRVLDPDQDADISGKQLVYQPRDLLNTSLTWRNPWVNAFIAFNYKGSQWLNDVNTEELEAFSFVDLHLWRPIISGVSLAVKIHNLLDQEYIDSRNRIAPGRMINAELRFSF